MSDCCSQASKTEHPKRLKCPVSGKECAAVGVKTLLHHLKRPWHQNLKEQEYYYCSDPNCDVIYFGQNTTICTQQALRTTVGLKLAGGDRVLCYCFDIKASDYEKDRTLKAFVLEQTKSGSCACDIQNPSGKCCLKDFQPLP